jgi:hypothetical protein
VLAGSPRWETGRRVDVAEHADERGTLVDKRDHRLRLDRAVLKRIDNLFLHLLGCAVLGPDRASVGDRTAPELRFRYKY